MEFLNSSKIENPRHPKNFGDPKKPANKPRKQPEQEHGRHGRSTIQGETPSTQPHNRPTASNGNQQGARAATTGAKARQNTTTQKQSKQHQRHADTRHNQHPRSPAPHTRQPANAQPTPPAPNARNNRPRTLAREHGKIISTVRLVYVKCWLCTTISRRARDMPSVDELALSGCFGPL